MEASERETEVYLEVNEDQRYARGLISLAKMRIRTMMSQQLIQEKEWNTAEENTALIKQLGFYDGKEISFHLNGQKNTEAPLKFYCGRQESWAQPFLDQNVFIGDFAAILSQYNSSFSYITFDYIFDFSALVYIDKAIEPINANSYSYRPIIPGDNHLSIRIDDTGINFKHELLPALRKSKVFEQINAARLCNKRVLINCAAGQSRSGTVCILYLMETYKVSFSQAFQYLKTIRPTVLPNAGYVDDLVKHEKQLTGIANVCLNSAKKWLEKYVNCHSVSQFPEFNSSHGGAQTNLNKYEFIDLVSFLQALRIPFTPGGYKSHGFIKLDAEAATHFIKVLNSKLLEIYPSENHQMAADNFNPATMITAEKIVAMNATVTSAVRTASAITNNTNLFTTYLPKSQSEEEACLDTMVSDQEQKIINSSINKNDSSTFNLTYHTDLNSSFSNNSILSESFKIPSNGTQKKYRLFSETENDSSNISTEKSGEHKNVEYNNQGRRY